MKAEYCIKDLKSEERMYMKTCLKVRKPPFSLKGDGTRSNPYVIECVEDYKIIGESKAVVKRDNYNTTYPSNAYYKLICNIICSDQEGVVLTKGSIDKPFNGHIDFNNKTIDIGMPLFDYIESATVENIRTSDAIVSKSAIGSVIRNVEVDKVKDTCLIERAESCKIYGFNIKELHWCLESSNPRNTTGAIVSNCIDSTVRDISINLCLMVMPNQTYSVNVGSIVGYAKDSKLIDCNVQSYKCWGCGSHKNRYVGGIAGYCEDTIIENCTVLSNESYIRGKWSGGIVGQAIGSKIKKCSSHVNVHGYIVGGILGSGYYSNMEECYHVQEVKGSEVAGGIAGILYNHFTINKCVKGYGDIWGGESAGGILGKADGGKIHGCAFEPNDSSIKGNKNVGEITGWSKDVYMIECVTAVGM